MTQTTERIYKALEQLQDTSVKWNNTNELYLANIYFWQEVCRLAESARDLAWVRAQSNGIIPDDDSLRSLRAGVHVVATSKRYQCTVAIAEPRAVFNRAAFIDSLVREFKLRRPVLHALTAECTGNSKTPLSKRVVEV